MRTIIRCVSNREALMTQERLSDAGVDAAAAPGPAVRARLAPEGEDVLVIPALDGDLERAGAYLRALPHVGERLCALAAAPSWVRLPTDLSVDTPFDGVIATDGAPELLQAQIKAFTRMSITAEERARRFATAVALGVGPPAAARPKPLKALYIGAPSPQFLALERAFSPAPGLVAAAFTSFCGFDYLHDDAFDAVVLNAQKDPATAIGLCAALRRNAQLYHMPTMVLTAPDDEATRRTAIARGACVAIGVDAPFEAPLGWLFEAIRRERRRRISEQENYALRDLMGEARTGLFRDEAFHAHVKRLAVDHHSSGRAFSVAIISATPRGGVSAGGATWRRSFEELCSLTARLVRDTDCATVLRADTIAIALPATGLEGARRSAERIASVAECTAFSVGGIDEQPLIFERSAAEMQPGESGEALLARAERSITEERVSA